MRFLLCRPAATRRRRSVLVCVEVAVDDAGEATIQAAQSLGVGHAFSLFFRGHALPSPVEAALGDRDPVNGIVELPVAPASQPNPGGQLDDLGQLVAGELGHQAIHAALRHRLEPHLQSLLVLARSNDAAAGAHAGSSSLDAPHQLAPARRAQENIKLNGLGARQFADPMPSFTSHSRAKKRRRLSGALLVGSKAVGNQREYEVISTRKLAQYLALTTLASGAMLYAPAMFASASPTPPAPTVISSEVSGMNVTGFDRAVAKAHGYKIVTLPNGDQQSVPVDPKSKLRSGPVLHKATTRMHTNNSEYDEVYGNCGQSWIRTTAVGDNKVSVASGYRYLPFPAFYWSWHITLTDPNGTSSQSYSHVTSGTSASRVWSNLNQRSWSYDRVSKGGATLDSGTICTSGHPDVRINGL